MPTEVDYQTELKSARESVKVLNTHRETLLRAEATEAQKAKDSQAKLVSLGITNAATLSVKDLEALQVEKQKELEAGLAKIKEQIAEGNRIMQEHEALGV
jgi:hypothetical protein